MTTVRDLRPDELLAATRVLVHAFDEDPALRWLLPDDHERARAAPHLARCWLEYGLRYGRVWCTDGVEAVAVRRPPGAEGLDGWGLLRSGGLRAAWALGPAAVLRMLRAGVAADARHADAVQGPHWYCWLLAVAPEHQGKGLAGALVDHTFAAADRDGVPCYLESTNPRSVAVHRHHGWRVVDDGPVPGTALQVWSMVRAPTNQASARRAGVTSLVPA